MNVLIDSREKKHVIGKIIQEFDERGVNYDISKLYVGDYMSLDNARYCIDRKQDLQELCGNVCQDHERFINELERAERMGIELVILCSHSPTIKTLEDVKEWYNPRLKSSPKATKGETLYKILKTVELRYNTKFLFCSKSEVGKEIYNLLLENEKLK